MSPDVRFALTTLGALISLITMYVDIAWSTPARVTDRKWGLLLNGMGGHFSYLTVNILCVWMIYWPACAVAEYRWSVLKMEDEFTRRLVAGVYAFAVFASSLGTVLTLLFLKFNWFNPEWQHEIRTTYLARGNGYFIPKILFTHMNQLPIAFFDLVVLKQNDHVLEWATVTLVNILLTSFAYTFWYLSFTHINHRMNKQIYPYPFMDKVFSSWRSESIFFVVLSLFCFVVTAFYHFVAVEADFIEHKIYKMFA